ncbi:hypothetical protein D9613_006705 [Agrocybe pediades]|uniref:Uncharacterized protein n=1 Tax=Agrocybe pediades TaxID=84607 RepID=A0A8H4VHL6_9AGAR|nr:hypothetical protein D9613_006705 [Agrocybe pediades]KAF9564238.1 hypothetical protein CPC08DRAFT_262535 [Agrocybe pediades]
MDNHLRKGAVLLPAGSEHVVDADEDIFILYSEIQTTNTRENDTEFRGLGYVDSHKDVLEVKFELTNVLPPPTAGKETSLNRRNKSRKPAKPLEKTIEIELLQDKTALRSRKGDTGSVLWKASRDFAQLILQQYYSAVTPTLLDRDVIGSQNVLELGAGTGLLSIALSPLVAHYTATDIGPLVPLIQKNVAHNFSGDQASKVSVTELDWIALQSASPSQRQKLYDVSSNPVDLILAVDCIYHPSLIPPFLTALDYLCAPGKTTALVVSELRAADVMLEFLDSWLKFPGWQVWRVPNTLLGKHYVIFVGWKEELINE